MSLSWQDALLDLPQVENIITSAITLINSEKAATTYVERQKLSEPLQEAIAALIDVLRTQAAAGAVPVAGAVPPFAKPTF